MAFLSLALAIAPITGIQYSNTGLLDYCTVFLDYCITVLYSWITVLFRKMEELLFRKMEELHLISNPRRRKVIVFSRAHPNMSVRRSATLSRLSRCPLQLSHSKFNTNLLLFQKMEELLFQKTEELHLISNPR